MSITKAFLLVIFSSMALVGCVEPEQRVTLSDQARDICSRNGFNLGTAGFNQCFNNTLATLNSQSIARRQAAIRNLQISNQMMNPPQAPIILTPPCVQQGGFCR